MEQAVAAIDLLKCLAGNTEPAERGQLLQCLFGVVHPMFDGDGVVRLRREPAAVHQLKIGREAFRIARIIGNPFNIADRLECRRGNFLEADLQHCGLYLGILQCLAGHHFQRILAARLAVGNAGGPDD